MTNNDIFTMKFNQMLNEGIPVEEISEQVVNYNGISTEKRADLQIRLANEAINRREFETASSIIKSVMSTENLSEKRKSKLKIQDIRIDIKTYKLESARAKINQLLDENKR